MRYGIWAEVCGSRYLFGNKVVRNQLKTWNENIIFKRTGELDAERGEMLQAGHAANLLHNSRPTELSVQINRQYLYEKSE